MVARNDKRVCKYCEFAEAVQYADGHYSIRCLHPGNDPHTTKDVVILNSCPKENNIQNQMGDKPKV